MAETNLTKTGDFAKAQNLDFVNRFAGSLTKFLETIGVTRQIPMASGTVVKTYKAVLDVQSGVVAEGEVIPLSKVSTVVDRTLDVVLKKFRKAISMEAIQKHGYDQAVIESDDKMLREIQRAIRQAFFQVLATGTTTGSGIGLQGALGQAWGLVQTLFEDDGVKTLCFVNPMDVADYIGQSTITTQTLFGMTFVSGFTDSIVLTSTLVPQGKIYATAPENIVCVFVPPAESEIAKAFTFETDETGFIGVSHQSVTDSLTYETTAFTGVLMFPERIDGVAIIDIEPAVA